jgi:hypothetical protein
MSKKSIMYAFILDENCIGEKRDSGRVTTLEVT